MNRLLYLASIALIVGACGGGTGGSDSGAGAQDGSAPSECDGAVDGTTCGDGTMSCQAGACVSASGCGNGVVDDGEACDDANTTAFDGCEPDCTFTCSADTECDDNLACNGVETCGAMTHVCEPGTAADDGSACTTTDVPDGVCVTTPTGAACVGAGCGNGVIDGTEQCDDENDVAADGCENDCMFSCESDSDCDDTLFCSGVEACDLTTHSCTPGTAPDCGDDNDCTDDVCDETAGACTNPLIDGDGDGHASTDLGTCGDDCNDVREDIFTGAEELCDGVDNNCDGMTDEVAPEWYVDCDGDGFAASLDSSRSGCDAPPAEVAGCPAGGGWTSRRPVSRADADCADDDADAFPGQTTYFTTAQLSSGSGDDERYGNYDCSGTAQRDHGTTAGVSGTCDLRRSFLRGGGYYCSGAGWTGATAPSCGGTGNYVSCGGVTECTLTRCSGYSLVCDGPYLSSGDPCYCPPRTTCTADCTPGTRGCAWHYYRCDASAASERMACR